MADGSGLTCVARVHGVGALGLVLAALRGADIWATSDLPCGTSTFSHHAIALGGTRVMVLDRDADDVMALLASMPPLVGRGLRGWRRIAFVVFLIYSVVPCSPFAVFLTRQPGAEVHSQT